MYIKKVRLVQTKKENGILSLCSLEVQTERKSTKQK